MSNRQNKHLKDFSTERLSDLIRQAEEIQEIIKLACFNDGGDYTGYSESKMHTINFSSLPKNDTIEFHQHKGATRLYRASPLGEVGYVVRTASSRDTSGILAYGMQHMTLKSF